MKKYHLFPFAPIFLFTFLAACNQSADKPAKAAAAEKPVKPDLYLYTVMVNDLNLREQAGKSGKVLSMLPEGSFVEGDGSVSAEREEVTLRGIFHNEPYVKITGPGELKGWAYGGALECFFAGTRAGMPDLQKVGQLTGFLKTLNTKELISGKKAWEMVQNQFGNVSGSTADAVFVLLEAFLQHMEAEGTYYTLTESLDWTDEDYRAIDGNKYDMSKKPVTQSLKNSGFSLAAGEGMVFPVVDWFRLRAFFSDKVTPPMKRFIELGTEEQHIAIWDDGGIIVPLEVLAARAIAWEQFNREYPYFLLGDRTRESERWMRFVLICGADNTPVFDYDSKEIEQDFKKVWAYIQEQYPGSKLAGAVKEIADLCAAESWKMTPKVEAWRIKFAAENN